ncbi:MAG: VCBS repeat-containing protein, partial [Candidatus Stahlbacteria bacterium]|nr:VCBS repeat-containing protein [Candidatus Stahlbacteria bacterium]
MVNLIFLSFLCQQLDWPMYMGNPQLTGVFPLGTAAAYDIPPTVKWTRNIPVGMRSSVAIGNIDSDGEIEVVVASTNGILYVLKGTDGTNDWTYSVGSEMWGAPAIANLDGDPAIEIVVGADDGILRVLDGITHAVEWSAQLDGPVYGSICISDLDNNGSQEIIVGTGGSTGRRSLWAYYGNGTLKWSTSLNRGMYATPSVKDIDKDGQVEVVMGTYNGDSLYSLNGNTGSIEWGYSSGGTPAFISGATLGDVTGDDTVDILIVIKGIETLRCLNGITRRVQWEYKKNGFALSGNPAIGNVDASPDIEVLLPLSIGGGIVSPILSIIGGNGSIKHEYPFGTSHYLSYGSPLLVDVTDNNILDIVIGTHSGTVHAIRGTGTLIWNNYTFNTDLEGAAAAGDIDNDGCLDIVGGGYKYESYQRDSLYALEFSCPAKVEEESEKWGLGGINVYPNPGFGSVAIKFGNKSASPVCVKIYDCTGKIVRSITATPG